MSELSQTLILGHYQDFLRGKEPRSCFPIARPGLNFTSGQQHGEHPLELAVEMNLVAAKPLELVWVERLTERLARQHPMTQRVEAGDLGAAGLGRECLCRSCHSSV